MKLPLRTLRFLTLGLALGLGSAAQAAPPVAPAAHVEAPHVEAQPAAPAGPRVVATHAEAAKEMGHGVMVATGSGMPANLMPAMRAHAQTRPGRTNVFYMPTFASEENFKEGVTDKWHPNLLFVSKPNREAASEAAKGMGRATLHRASLFELAGRIERDELPIDTVVVRVSPPDAEGNVSLGTTSDLTMLAVQSVLRRGGKIIAEVNPNVPHTRGNRIPYAKLSHVVHGNEMLAEAIQLVPMAAETAIAGHIARLVPVNQKHTVQVGIGDSLAGVGDALKDNPMDIWSEMAPPGLLKLVNAPNSKVGTAVFSFLHADNASYKLAHDNPRITLSPSNIVNDPATIAAKPRMVAINTGLEVDLFGNVNAERDGTKVISAPGGQPDFMKGASLAADGKAIMALRSTAKGNLSSIVIGLKGPTTTPKDNVDHVVTEWGATARLRGQPDGVRAYQLITVAHPAFRGELADHAKQAGLITEAQAGELKASVYHAVVGAPAETREALANAVLEKGLISNDQHTEIVVDLLMPKIPGYNVRK
jgi:acyl-CoA hydrolase